MVLSTILFAKDMLVLVQCNIYIYNLNNVKPLYSVILHLTYAFQEKDYHHQTTQKFA